MMVNEFAITQKKSTHRTYRKEKTHVGGHASSSCDQLSQKSEQLEVTCHKLVHGAKKSADTLKSF